MSRSRNTTRAVAISLIISGTLALATPALAQKTGPNGGMLAGKSGHETELVIKPDELTVYMIDNGKAHSTKGATLRAVVQTGATAATIPLQSVDDKKFVGKLSSPIAPGAIVVLTGKDDHGDAVSARYVIK